MSKNLKIHKCWTRIPMEYLDWYMRSSHITFTDDTSTYQKTLDNLNSKEKLLIQEYYQQNVSKYQKELNEKREKLMLKGFEKLVPENKEFLIIEKTND